jgi:serine phosphatase RsbU (regulator of sigma subunit)/anti-anti-sigma regulatory factor
LASSHPPDEREVPSILIVDDDEDVRELLVTALRVDEPRLIEEAATAEEAKQRLARRAFAVVITDLSMPGEGGLSLMHWSQEHCAGPCWIVLTGHGTFDTAVEALQLGAFDFLSKPLRGVEPLRNAVRNALAQQRLLAERDRLHAELEESNTRLRGHVEQLERACRLLREQADTIRADLIRAGIIQAALLPRAVPKLGDFHVHALYRPSHNVGGDLYDVIRFDDRHAGLLVADAAGHGLSAAMLAVLFRSQLPFVSPDSPLPLQPREVLAAANRALCEALPARGLFLTAAYCLLDTETRRAVVASAGHPPALVLRRRGGIERLFHSGPALGLAPDADFSELEIALEPGDRILFYSDGLYPKLPATDGPPVEAVAAALQERDGDGADLLRGLARSPAVDERADAVQEDDITLLMLTAAPGTSVLDNGTLQPQAAPPPAPSESRILRGEMTRRTALCIQGRGDWNRSAAFHAECTAAIEAGRDVMLDLALCRQLDSTFLGTIHLLCELADQADVEFRLQGVVPAVEKLFEELGMDTVMDHIVPCMLPLPTRMEPLSETRGDAFPEGSLVLQAHESLAALSDRNREEFDPILALLRREVRASGPQ